VSNFSLLFLPLAALFFSFTTMKKTTRVVFFGDSITEAAVYPGGYIAKLRDQLATQQDSFELIGKGIGGNKIYDLYLRLEDDVLALRPDVVFVYVGVNDVWHKRLAGTGTDADKFERFYTALIRKMQQQNIRVVLCTPACIGEHYDCTNPQDGEINQFSQIIRDLARRMDCGLCDLRSSFMNYSSKNNPANLERGILTTDGVHLNDLGNQMVADQMLSFLTR
jgi:lysophospholipase L1-like esterase